MLLVCGLLLELHSPAETLREKIVSKGIDPSGLDSPNLDKTITSGAESDDADLFLAAYYLDDGSGCLRGPIYVEMPDKKKHQWTHKVLDTRSLKDFLHGSIGIGHTARGIHLHLHINPSTGTLVILSPSLEIRGSVYGFFLVDYSTARCSMQTG